MSEFWEPWSPRVGDRVQVRLSGECQQYFGSALDSEDGPVVRYRRGPQVGHPDSHNHRGGVVNFVLTPGERFHSSLIPETINGHRYGVLFDEADPTTTDWGSTFAAIELEPLTEAQP